MPSLPLPPPWGLLATPSSRKKYRTPGCPVPIVPQGNSKPTVHRHFGGVNGRAIPSEAILKFAAAHSASVLWNLPSSSMSMGHQPGEAEPATPVCIVATWISRANNLEKPSQQPGVHLDLEPQITTTGACHHLRCQSTPTTGAATYAANRHPQLVLP